MSHDAFWSKLSTKRLILKQLLYRLCKFQQALPVDDSLEMIGNYLLDISGTIQFLQQGLETRG